MRLNLGRFLLTALLLGSFVACTKSGPANSPTSHQQEEHRDRPEVAENQVNGGVDGSGGFAGVSTVDQVASVHEKVLERPTSTFKKIESIIGFGKLDPADRRWTKRRLELLTGMIQGNQKLNQGVRELLESGKIKWQLRREGPCHATDHRHTDGAAMEPLQICISFQRLTRFAYSELEGKVLQLYSHELAHLYFGESEDSAVEIDSFFAEIPEIAFPDPEKLKVTLEKMELTPIPKSKLEMFQKNKTELYCFLPSIYLMFGAVMEFRATIEKPDPKVYFSPEFKTILEPARNYTNFLHSRNEDGFDMKCQADPRGFYGYDQLESAITSFENALAYWKSFYADEMISSKAKPVDVETR